MALILCEGVKKGATKPVAIRGYRGKQELELGTGLENNLDFARAGNWNFPVAGSLLGPLTQLLLLTSDV